MFGVSKLSGALTTGPLTVDSEEIPASKGNYKWPILKIATALGPLDVSIIALKGRVFLSSTSALILVGVLSGPCHISILVSKGLPLVFNVPCTLLMAG